MTLTDKELTALIAPIVGDALSSSGLDRVEIESRLDRDGDPIVDISAHFRVAVQRLPPHVTFALSQKILDALNERGDDRFPHLLMLYAGEGDEPENFYPVKRGGRSRRAS